MSKININWNLQISISKVFAFVSLGLGTWVSIVLKSELAFITTITTTTALIANKQYQDRIKAIKETMLPTTKPNNNE